MEERKKIIEFFYKELEKLKTEEHVEDLMKARRSEELKRIVEKIDFSPVRKFIEKNESLDLSKDEIKEEFCYEIVIYIWGSGKGDWDFFEEDDEFRDVLYEKEEELAEAIADLIAEYNLCDCTLGELLDY